ncbi:adenylate/guanylate cyclase domain-containing protein [Leisingera sp. ANG59]|uniref:adenylate/guanylate cyclase domain-containing protein n=1 Tax=Leisingera sp. ANG59 TaxID=2675221 RepID=UPI001573711E|nr:adenylate/guanylate cyclase domain-containing protein [Leisingera sp. ANG59]NSY41005.1 hypothetical protein [Leisingera sp. ANG59]
MREISEWLTGLGLERCAKAFAENDIDYETLFDLTAQDLTDIGVVSVGHRRKLLKAISQLAAPQDEAHRKTAKRPKQEAERRQVTVLFADLAGFTALAGRIGAEAAHGVLNRFFQVVDGLVNEYGGTVDKHIGDSVMAVFGAPVAHDRDPELAVRCACEIHTAIARVNPPGGSGLQAHIGIASGQVVASGTGSETYSEYTVTGNAVNLAARLQELAEAGETVISDEAHAQIDRVFHATARSMSLGIVPARAMIWPRCAAARKYLTAVSAQ